MKRKLLTIALALCSLPIHANESEQLRKEIMLLQQQTQALQAKLVQLQKQIDTKPAHQKSKNHIKRTHTPATGAKNPGIATTESTTSGTTTSKVTTASHQPKSVSRQTNKAVRSSAVQVARHSDEPVVPYHTSTVTIHAPDADPESLEFYPTALVANDHVVTYIAGTPVVASPYLGSRPAFDGSDYIVNISSINRDIRLMQQRRRLDRAYESIGYSIPKVPIIALSGKVEPIATVNRPYLGKNTGDINLGSSELDVAAVLNDKVEAYIGIAYDNSPPEDWGQRIANSGFGLNMGFVNIGDLDESPFYLTAGQLYAPFGRFSTAMVSAPVTMVLARTKARQFILGYKSQDVTGPFAALYGFNSDTTKGSSAAGGFNLGYTFGNNTLSGEIGGSIISSINDAAGMQDSGSQPNTSFGGFGSITNGSEFVKKIPGVGAHYNMSFDRYNLTAEWVGSANRFREQDLSYNGRGARPQAGQVEGGVTFMSFNRPSSFALGYQWTKQSLALNLPAHRISAVYSISIWKDTVESLEYRHDIDYKHNTYANGAAPPDIINQNTLGTGKSSDMLLAQIGVYF